ncbi:GHMP kinase [Streptosporangium sp. NPDC000396]|uniref:GHMP family kinase ATP-binding protein n=1 Tax=Streptosporangium sp. NPDC000396 TaxID=3366185 RepID=UPI0036C4CFF8
MNGNSLAMVDSAGHVERGPGSAWVAAHHGELLQGVFADGGKLRRGLVTIPCGLYSTEAIFEPSDADSVTVTPAWKSKAHRAARLTLAELGWPSTGGRLTIHANIPPSRGFGSSTSDVVAAIWAVQNAFHRPLATSAVARLAVRAETASDSLMFSDQTVLFAHREGEVIEGFAGRLMPLGVVGFGTSHDGSGVDTLSLPRARYSTWEVEAFQVLRAMLRNAIETGDVELLGRVATGSARINQRHLAVRDFERLEALAGEAGAIGVQVAHSGDIAGLLFDAADPEMEARMEAAGELLTRAGMTNQWHFRTDK